MKLRDFLPPSCDLISRDNSLSGIYVFSHSLSQCHFQRQSLPESIFTGHIFPQSLAQLLKKDSVSKGFRVDSVFRSHSITHPVMLYKLPVSSSSLEL